MRESEHGLVSFDITPKSKDEDSFGQWLRRQISEGRTHMRSCFVGSNGSTIDWRLGDERILVTTELVKGIPLRVERYVAATKGLIKELRQEGILPA